ncbi:MAG: hypothetical protein NVS4B8_00090 [Herpetosiphon sp.]
MTHIFDIINTTFDAVNRRWDVAATQRRVGTGLVLTFIVALIVIQTNRLGLLPEGLRGLVGVNHFRAVGITFNLLLLAEIVGLILVLAGSVANSVGKQFEILSLILLRKAFEEFSSFSEPLLWHEVSAVIGVIVADAIGAMLIFAATGYYYGIQQHRPITQSAAQQRSFIAAKELIALTLLGLLIYQIVVGVYRYATVGEQFFFFETFFTKLIFSDVLIVLVSLRYNTTFTGIFRNFGFAVATVLIRLAITAEGYFNAILGLTAVFVAIGLTLTYNRFAAVIVAESELPMSAASRNEVDVSPAGRTVRIAD